ncbi:MAG: TVP38/TMEM64 family protein [Oscillatoriales cyanobacterium]|nr:MAG: TVP38/TMEM64 family protein [Oscillatoriales cyanobacterium]
MQDFLQSILIWIEHLGAWGAIVFIAVYGVATVALVPGSLLTLGAGVLFGLGWGSVLVFVGATVGATAAFLVGRYGLRDWVAQRWIDGNDRFQTVDRAIAREGFKIVLLMRLSPLFPFNALNYMLGLTRVSLRDYVLASIGMLPGTIAYVYIGASFRSLATLFAGSADRAKSPLEWLIFGAGLLATLGVTVVVTRTARAALARATEDSIS